MFADKVATFLVTHRKRNAWCTIIFVLLLSCFATRIVFENSIESFLPESDPARISYANFKQEFGDDQIMLLAIPMGEVFTFEHLNAIKQITEQIEELPLVKKVRSITNTQDIAGSESGFEVETFLKDIPNDAQQLKKMRTQALNNPLYQIDLIALDSKTASIVVEAEVSEDDARYKEIRDGVTEIMADTPYSDTYFFAGDPIVELQMTNDMWRDLGVFIPLTYLCLAVVLFLAFRDLQGVVVPLIIVALGTGALQGFAGLVGITMNVVTVGLPSLMLCIGILDCVHILTVYRKERSLGEDETTAIQAAVAYNLKPCFFTSVTTAIGFLSISVNELTPIREFGFLAAYCTTIIYPICFLIIPYLLERIPTKNFDTDPTQWKVAVLIRWVLRAHMARKTILFSVVAILAVSAFSSRNVVVETSNLKFLRKSNPVRISADFIEANLGGITPIEIVITADDEGAMKNPAILAQIDQLQQFMTGLKYIDKTISPVQFIKDMHQSMNNENPEFYRIPENRDLIAQYILTYSFSGRDNDLDDYVDYSYRIARIQGRVQHVGSAKLVKLIEQIERYIEQHFDSSLKIDVTSRSALEANMVNSLVRGQIKGLAIGIGIMLAIIAVIHRSLLVGVVSLIPNTIPLIVAAGVMGAFEIPLNAGTAMTACIALGLIVDDTLFFLHYARKNSQADQEPEVLVRKTLSFVGVPVLYTSLLLTLGFVILVFGQSNASVYFGVLCATAIAVALLADLFVLPMLLYMIPRFRRALTDE